jgi:DNA-directed RNA polymerase subunit RPC12/RpoP
MSGKASLLTRIGESVAKNTGKAGRKKLAEKDPDQVTCPACSSRNARAASRKDNFRPRSHTGNLQADLTPISVTVTYRCRDCGHEWSETDLRQHILRRGP